MNFPRYPRTDSTMYSRAAPLRGLSRPWHKAFLARRISERVAPLVIMDYQRQQSPIMAFGVLGSISSLFRHLRTSTRNTSPTSLDSKPALSAAKTPSKREKLETSAPSTTTPSPPSSSSLRDRMPKDAWDSHMHILDPHYPLAPQAAYTPPRALIPAARALHGTLGITKTVLVQPSIYGTDNACLLDALRALGPDRAAGVVAFEPGAVPSSTLREWHALGVRGVRVNLASVGKDATGPELEELLRGYAAECAPLGWSVQVYLPMRMIELLEPIVPKLAAAGVRICIDHMGHPSLHEMEGRDPYNMRGFQSLVNLLHQGNTYVKLSAPYRFLDSDPEDVAPLEPIARELLRVAGTNRVVFATDWPHTRFDELDIKSWVEAVLEWCDGDEGLVERVFRGNAEELWGDKSIQ